MRKNYVFRVQYRLVTLLLAVAFGQTACGGQGGAGLPLGHAPGDSPPIGGTAQSASSTYKTAILSDSPVLYYRLDQGPSASIYDYAGNSHSGTLYGSATYNVAGALVGDPDTALGFNGTSTHVVSSVPVLGNSYSLEAWFKTYSSAEQHIIDVYPQVLRILHGRVSFGSGGNYVESGSSNYADNKYHHVVVTYDSHLKSLYIDGSLASSASAPASISSGIANIGHYYGGGVLFNGYLDEIAMYAHPLSSTQVLTHYQVGVKSNSSSPTPRSTNTPTPKPDPNPSPSSGPTHTPTPHPTARPTPTPTPPTPSPTPNAAIAMKHVLTSDYDNTALSATARAPYLTWMDTSWQNNPTVRAAGIKAMYYTNPNRVLPSQSFWSYVSNNENNFAHDCSGHRILSTAYGEYITDPGVHALSTVKQAWLAFIQSRTDASHHWDAFFEDDTNDVAGVNAQPCGYDSQVWGTASEVETAFQSPYPIIFNGLSLGVSEWIMDNAPNVIGGMSEGCYSASTSLPKIWPPYWTNAANIEIHQAQVGKLFFCMTQDTTSASSATASRIYSYASFLLTYSASSSVYWSLHTTPSGFNVLPETQLVPTHPLVSTPGDISGLQISGVYGREYASCYVNGRSVGPCAAVVNPDRFNAHAYPYGSKYRHTLTLSGSSILDGGSIATNGSAPPTTLGNLTAVVVFQ